MFRYVPGSYKKSFYTLRLRWEARVIIFNLGLIVGHLHDPGITSIKSKEGRPWVCVCRDELTRIIQTALGNPLLSAQMKVFLW